MTLIEIRRPPWHADAACRGLPPDLFYTKLGEPTQQAKAVCASCPVTTPCLEFALTHHEKFGIWGGKSERERRHLRSLLPGRPPLRRTCPCWWRHLPTLR